ncbi:MAG TPA: hypothetical protein VMB80_17325 [Candidatus Acidoferrum sp.]|nr:hypothetical protein [Candidatus Acidoferrum sp.]
MSRFAPKSLFRGWVIAFSLLAVSVKANPAAPSVVSAPLQPQVLIPIAFAILAEAICIVWLLRRWRHPHLLILWLMGMHLLTYPLFLGWLWLTYGMHPALGVATGEGWVVIFEGCLIYLLCRFRAPRRSTVAAPSITRTLVASLLGNICSAVIFPVLMILYFWLIPPHF